MSKLLCIYHGNCADGFGAAWIVRKAFGPKNVEFFLGVYQTAPPDVTGRHVLLVDFAYKRPVLLEMAKTARSIVILDHHKTAQEDLQGFRAPAPFAEWRNGDGALVEGGREPIAALFDLNHSGAMLAWEFFFPEMDSPPLLQHIEDRDLWRFKLSATRAIQAGLFSFPYDFEMWDGLMEDSYLPEELDRLRVEGEAIERKHFKDIDELLAVTKRRMVIGGVSVPVANLPYTLSSDAGHKLALEDETKIGACYWDVPDGRVFSLRSTDDGPDVSAIAKQYGGGGHPHAAGFKAATGWEGEAP